MTKRMFLIVFSLVAALFISACDNLGGTPDPSFTLTVNVTGDGTVTSSNGDIDCGSDCDQTYTESTEVTLTAKADDGATFSGWSGDCSGSAECVVTVDGAKTVTASFAENTGPFLFRAYLGAGEGTITTADGNINCQETVSSNDPNNCEEQYAGGTKVVVTATPATGFVFDRFSGSSCTPESDGSNVCTYDMTKARDSIAYFRPEGEQIFTIEETTDDAEEYTNTVGNLTEGTVSLDSSDLELNHDEGAGLNQIVGIRFAEVTTDTEKVIDEVYIEFLPKVSDATVPNLEITAELNANPPTFAAITNNISSRTSTLTSVPWAPGAWTRGEVSEATRTPNLLPLMQEAGWTSGGAVVFIIKGEDSTAQRSTKSSDASVAEAPKLIVTYQ